eukprot:1190607-Prorocentrum_minimum.AAC.4
MGPNGLVPFVCLQGHVRKIFKSLKQKRSGDKDEPVQVDVQVNWYVATYCVHIIGDILVYLRSVVK